MSRSILLPDSFLLLLDLGGMPIVFDDQVVEERVEGRGTRVSTYSLHNGRIQRADLSVLRVLAKESASMTRSASIPLLISLI